MKVVKCGGCGAPFHEAPEDTTVVCAFCGALNEPTVLKRPEAPVGTPSGEFPAVQIVMAREPPQAARAVRKVGLLATIFALTVTILVIALTAGAIWFGLRKAVSH